MQGVLQGGAIILWLSWLPSHCKKAFLLVVSGCGWPGEAGRTVSWRYAVLPIKFYNYRKEKTFEHVLLSAFVTLTEIYSIC